jgi:hypothetical protein
MRGERGYSGDPEALRSSFAETYHRNASQSNARVDLPSTIYISHAEEIGLAILFIAVPFDLISLRCMPR